ncbi:MAG: PDZ domain-containing protein [Bryobacterales bacterium]|nr:PDZ domain-containing protein [Bryobacterales bacterium]
MRLQKTWFPALVLASLTVVPLAAQKVEEGSRRGPVFMAGGSRSFLGVGVVEVTAERARALKLSDEHGVEITRIDEDSPAARAGLKPQDIVLEYQGQRVEGVEQFVRLVRETPAGREVKLLVFRSGQSVSVVAALESRRVRMIEVGDVQVAIPSISVVPPEIQIGDLRRGSARWSTTALGIEAERLESQLAEYFGVREGVLVRSVISASPAEKAGIRAGDVITKVGESKVASPPELVRQLRAAEGRSASLSLVRERKPLAISVQLEAETESGRPKARAVRVLEQ